MRQFDKEFYEDLLSKVLKVSPYNKWKKIRDDDYRDPDYQDVQGHQNISPISLSRTGLTNLAEKRQIKSLVQLAKDLGVFESPYIESKARPAESDFETIRGAKERTDQKRNQAREGIVNLAPYIYHNSSMSDADRLIVKGYFQNRGMIISDDFIEKTRIRVNRYQGKRSIVFPLVNTHGKIHQIEKIELTEELTSKGKRKLGKTDGLPDRALVIHPENENGIVIESFTDSAAIYHYWAKAKDYRITISGGTAGFHHINSFVRDGDYVILDPDPVILHPRKRHDSFDASLNIDKDVTRLMPTLGVGIDAAKAVEIGMINLWFDSLRVVRSIEDIHFAQDYKPKEWNEILILEYLNQRHALIDFGGKLPVILCEKTDLSDQTEIISVNALNEIYANDCLDDHSIAEIWMNSNEKRTIQVH